MGVCMLYRKIKKLTALLLILILGITLLPLNFKQNKAYAAETINNAVTKIKVGDYVKFGSYLGKPIFWRAINVDSTGSPMLLSDDILTLKPYDAAESGTYEYGDKGKSTDYDRQTYGSNNWGNSNIREWLNSSDKTVKYSTQAPVKNAVGYNSYSSEAGFLTNFSKDEQNFIKPITHKSILSDIDKGKKAGGTELFKFPRYINKGVNNYDSSYYENVSDKVYLPDINELYNYVYKRGYDIEKGATQQAIDQSEYKTQTLTVNYNWPYSLRTPIADTTKFTTVVDAYGDYSINGYCGAIGKSGIAPVLNLKNCLCTGTGTFDAPYVPKIVSKNRISGNSRYDTAAQVSRKGWNSKCKTAVIATGENFPDALCAAPLAKKNNAPILLTESALLSVGAKQELQRLQVENVYIIGGFGAISKNTENQIRALGIKNITRISGNTRYETSDKIAEQMGTPANVVIATGLNFPDALSMAPVAALEGMPILLTETNQLPAVTKAYLDKNKAAIANTYVIGGTGAVSETVKGSLKNPLRLAGVSRYGTNIKILNQFKGILNLSNVYIATGSNFPDAISCSALAPMTASPIILADGGYTEYAGEFLYSNIGTVNSLTAVGGVGAVPDSILYRITDN